MLGVQQESLGLILHWVLDFVSHDLNVLEQHHCLKSTKLHSLHGIFDTKGDHASIEGNLLEESANDLLLLDELDIGKRVLRQSDSLVEALIKAVGHIDRRDNLVLKSIIKVITLLHHELQVGATSDNDTTHVGLVVRDEVLGGELTALDDVEMTLLFSETRETNGGLTTTTVLLGKLHRHTLNDLFVVSLEGGKKHSITINDDEAELVVVLQEGEQGLSEEVVLALVGEDVDGAERCQIDLDLLLSLAVLHQDHSAEDAQTIFGCLLVKLQLLTRRGNG